MQPEHRPTAGPGLSPQFPDTAAILVVEDNQVNAMILSAMLRKQGYIPLLAANGHEGIRLAEMHRPRLILMDLQMPSLDGLAAAREIRRRQGADTGGPVLIAVTANVGGSIRTACEEAGFAGVLAKPIILTDLCEIVGRYLTA